MITGTTRLIAHLGVPTESFKAPMIYNPYFKESGIDAVVVPMGCEADDFPVFLKSVAKLRNFAGALITMPHKVTVVDLLDEASPNVLACGSCNAVKRAADGRLIGDMFDGEGFVRAVLRHERQVAGASALVVGCGGAGSAIAASLAQAGAARIGLCDIDRAKAQALAARLSAHYPNPRVSIERADPEGWDIAVNATALGMSAADPLPMETDRLSADAFVGDVVLTAQQTPFINAAQARGCATQVGIDMLFEMIPAYLEFFGFPATTADNLRRLARLPSGDRDSI